MQIESIADVRMAGRALANGWLDGTEDKKREAVNALYDVVIKGTDQEIRIKAFDALVKADKADLKREEVALKKQELDAQRLRRQLEFIKHLPPGELVQIASDHKASVADGGANGPA